MQEIKFERLLRQSILYCSEMTESHFKKIESPKLNIKHFGTIDFGRRSFYGMHNHHLTLILDRKDYVESITVHFRGVIDREFYDAFIEVYGKPNQIQIIEEIIPINKETIIDKENNIKQELLKKEFILREGTFDENPLYIIWKKENFQIKAFLRRKQNISEITYSVIN